MLLQLLEDLRGLIRRRGPNDFQPRESKRQEHQFGLQVCWVCGCRERRRDAVGIGKRIECERLILIEFDEKHWILVVLQHGLGLVEESAILERGY